MSEKPKKPPAETDPKQSERFREAVRELEAAGDLNLTEAETILDKVLRQTNAKA